MDEEPDDAAPRPLRARGAGPSPIVFHHGAHAPYAIRWFGITSLFGHLRHFVASAIASESVDARDWMRPQTPDDLLRAVTVALDCADFDGARDPLTGLVEALGRPLWIDFVADTGDDRDVSLAVARMIFRAYDAPDGRLPRGDILFFGGDTAYPVATAEEIHDRVIVPFNEALAEAPEAEPRPRVLLGIPGNHDWYDGLDGFARMFRARTDDRHDRASELPRPPAPDGPPVTRAKPSEGRKRGLLAKQLHLDEVGGLFGLVASALRSVGAFFKGTSIRRRKRLTLHGYQSVQEASYFVLPLARGLEVWGVDRQLRRLDFRQRSFFHTRRRAAHDARIVFVAPDPAIAFGERHEPGALMLSACKLSLKKDRMLYLTGDVHHYERRDVPGPLRADGQPAPSLHVIAGGGGAFLHGSRVSDGPGGAPRAVFPDAATSRALLAQVPFKLMAGKAGLLAHLALALVASIELGADASGGGRALGITGLVIALLTIVVLYMVAGHHRSHPRRVATVAIPFGIVLGLGPALLKIALPRVVPLLAGDTAVILVYAFAGAFVIGLFLATLVLAGIEHQQAFCILGHPGFKHFVRLCVHPDGRIEGWAIGKDDPLDDLEPVLIDRFEWL